jgi:hypothetical protein
MKKISKWIIGFTAVLVLSIWPADKAFSEKIGVFKTPQAHTWVKMLKEIGATARYVTLKNAFSTSGISTLVFPSAFQFPEGEEEKYLKEVQDYVKKGGKVLAVGRAGYNKGVFHLTPILRAGASSYAYSPAGLYNYKTGKPPYDREVFKARAESIMQKGADGFWFYSFINLKAPMFLPDSAKKKNIPDFEQTARYVFDNAEKWKVKQPFSITPINCPDTMKAMWIRDWMTYRSRGMSVEDMVDICHKIGCNWIILGFEQRIRGVKMYSSEVDIIPGHPEYRGYERLMEGGKYAKAGEPTSPVQTDWMERLIKKCQEHNIGLWVNVLVKPRKEKVYYEYYPEDEGIDISGKPGSLCPIKISQRFFLHQSRWIEEVLRKYPYISGLVLDEPVHAVYNKRERDKRFECFCPECKKAFKDYCGKKLTSDTAYADEKSRTSTYQEFLQNMYAKYRVYPYSALLHRINPEFVLAIANYFYDSNAGLYSNLADEGADVLLPEFARGSSSMPLIWKHKLQYFDFVQIKGNSSAEEIRGDAIKVKLYQGAEVQAWVSDGIYRYPGIVFAHKRKTAYLSFDPTAIEYRNGKEIITSIMRSKESKGWGPSR